MRDVARRVLQKMTVMGDVERAGGGRRGYDEEDEISLRAVMAIIVMVKYDSGSLSEMSR